MRECKIIYVELLNYLHFIQTVWQPERHTHRAKHGKVSLSDGIMGISRFGIRQNSIQTLNFKVHRVEQRRASSKKMLDIAGSRMKDANSPPHKPPATVHCTVRTLIVKTFWVIVDFLVNYDFSTRRQAAGENCRISVWLIIRRHQDFWFKKWRQIWW